MSNTANNPLKQKWILRIILLILIFSLLLLATWLFYDYKIQQINHRIDQY